MGIIPHIIQNKQFEFSMPSHRKRKRQHKIVNNSETVRVTAARLSKCNGKNNCWLGLLVDYKPKAQGIANRQLTSIADCLLLARVDFHGADVLSRIVDNYHKASGHEVNFK